MNFKAILKMLLRRFSEAGVEVALSGGLALSTMGVFRFTKDIDFVVLEEWVGAVEEIMKELGYWACSGIFSSVRKRGSSG
jgi:hypothetical protein